MPYLPGHSESTRKRIVEHAAKRFREEGLDVGIGKLMQEIGLTHGGFYAHFESKNHLIQQALEQAAQDTVSRLMEAATRDPDHAFERVVEHYLEFSHCTRPEEGCLLPAVVQEVGRHDGEVRETFTALLERMFSLMETLLHAAPVQERRGRAIATLATLAGSVSLARAVQGPHLQQEILNAARENLLRPFRTPE